MNKLVTLKLFSHFEEANLLGNGCNLVEYESILDLIDESFSDDNPDD